ncbi:PepSY-associated TM helix domain-containing protein [Streptosporangium sp. NPDC087985]|uniref:PepSY-associated TM helix domain-containing protein n=1 Tax=Streptosporangium sp. NPDC087985 TaxID=3366196 RepID=UPI00382F9AC1
MTSDLETQPARVSPDPDASASSRRSGWAAIRPLVLRLHFYAGILIAPFLLVAATTGLLYATSFQLERLVYAHELTAPVGATTLPLSQQITAARAAHPEGTISAVRTPAEPGRTTQVLLNVPELEEGLRLAVFVDPHTGQIRGAEESYGSSGALPLRTWISNLHRTLLLGEPGRIYSELAASWLWVVALGGVLLWLGRRRPVRRLRAIIAPDRTLTGRRRTLSWHGSVGLWVAAGLLFLSATGLTWSKYAGENVDELRAALGWTTPSVSAATGDHADHAGHMPSESAEDASVDQIVQAAAGKGLSGPLEIVWPSKPADAYVVKEIDKEWPQRLDQVAVDPATGQVTDELRFADFPLAAKLTRWGIDGHMGLLFGLANQIVVGALAIGLVFLIVYGYRMWWQRRPTQKRFGRPYPRGTWRQVPRAVLPALAAVAVAVGLFLPLLGISLAAFLVVDVLLGLLRGRPSRGSAGAST